MTEKNAESNTTSIKFRFQIKRIIARVLISIWKIVWCICVWNPGQKFINFFIMTSHHYQMSLFCAVKFQWMKYKFPNNFSVNK